MLHTHTERERESNNEKNIWPNCGRLQHSEKRDPDMHSTFSDLCASHHTHNTYMAVQVSGADISSKINLRFGHGLSVLSPGEVNTAAVSRYKHTCATVGVYVYTCFLCARVCVCVCVYINRHTYTHARICICIYTCTCRHKCIHTQIYAYTHALICMIHAYIHTQHCYCSCVAWADRQSHGSYLAKTYSARMTSTIGWNRHWRLRTPKHQKQAACLGLWGFLG
jgi:hypothetical protein